MLPRAAKQIRTTQAQAVEWIVRGGSAVTRDYVGAWLARDPGNGVAQELKARVGAIR